MVQQDLQSTIVSAFADVEYPGDGALSLGHRGVEPALVAQEFRGKDDWRALSSEFIDEAPGGYASALEFLSDRALRFYLPAYLLADLENRLLRQDPVHVLTHGLTDAEIDTSVNPHLYGAETWRQAQQSRFAAFNRRQCEAIVAYLRLRQQRYQGLSEAAYITEALRNYWLGRIA